MKKNGFTLVELLAVIVILAVIALIAVPNVVNLMSGSKQDAYDIQINNIKAAMKNYVSKKTFSFPSTGSVYLTLYQLANEKLIDYKISNPQTGNYISLDTVLEIRNVSTGLEYYINIDGNNTVYNSNQYNSLPVLELYNDYGTTSSNLENMIKVATYNGTNVKNDVVITQLSASRYKFTLEKNNISVSVFYNIIDED